MRDRVILTKNFNPWVSTVIWHFCPKIVFPAILAAILNFCVKHKNAFISETRPDRAILMTPRVYTESLANFCQKLFSRNFWQPS